MAEGNGASATASASSGGIGLGGAVFLVFLVLKLVGVIDWSWWWVTAPLWGAFAIVAAILLLVGVVYGLVWVFCSAADYIGRKRRRGW